MNRLLKLGLATVLALSVTSFAQAEDVKTGAKMAAGADAALTTGSVGSNYGSLISTLQAGKSTDLAGFNSGSTVECVKVSTLKADGSNNAQALDNALTKNRTSLDTWQDGLKTNTDLMAKIKTTCGVSTDVDVRDILAIKSGTNGAFTVYFDDRA